VLLYTLFFGHFVALFREYMSLLSQLILIFSFHTWV